MTTVDARGLTVIHMHNADLVSERGAGAEAAPLVPWPELDEITDPELRLADQAHSARIRSIATPCTPEPLP